ncbi:hypothetical protein EI94DRAFT_1708943 [Lactarius quietus]|nr:hypothetical protein EI94DRAFT_1708943 [Lactarius quietus]
MQRCGPAYHRHAVGLQVHIGTQILYLGVCLLPYTFTSTFSALPHPFLSPPSPLRPPTALLQYGEMHDTVRSVRSQISRADPRLRNGIRVFAACPVAPIPAPPPPPERSRPSTCASNTQFSLEENVKHEASMNRGDEGKAGKKMCTCHRMRSPRLHLFGTARRRAHATMGAPVTPCASPPDACLRNPRTARGRDAHVGTNPCPQPVTSHKDANNSDAAVGTGAGRIVTKVTEKEVKQLAGITACLLCAKSFWLLDGTGKVAKMLAEPRAAESGALAYPVCGLCRATHTTHVWGSGLWSWEFFLRPGVHTVFKDDLHLASVHSRLSSLPHLLYYTLRNPQYSTSYWAAKQITTKVVVRNNNSAGTTKTKVTRMKTTKTTTTKETVTHQTNNYW